jgi:hypothetical protein
LVKSTSGNPSESVTGIPGDFTLSSTGNPDESTTGIPGDFIFLR